MRSLVACGAAVFISAFLAAQPAITPQPFARYTPGTVAQDLAVTPKGGWTYIVGSTTDPGYPITADAFDRTCGTDGACNVFQGRFGPERRADVVLTIFDAAGEIRYSTFIGGAGQDDNPRLALARDGTLWLAGSKTSDAFENGPGCAGSLWIARLDYLIRRIEQFACIGGPVLADIALDADGSLWILGTTGSATPTTADALQPVIAGQTDMFIAHLSSSQASTLYATYLGGDRLDRGAEIAITPAGDVAVVGSTNSTNFPLVRAAKTAPPGSIVQGDAVVLVLDRSGRFLEFSTYWGGAFDDVGDGVALDSAGSVYVTGRTASADMPVSADAFDGRCDLDGACRGWDAYVARFSPTGELIASTYFGGSALDAGRDITVRPNGQVIVLGTTQSPDFPLLGGQPFQRWRPGPNFEHTWQATFDDRLQRVTRSVFVGSEEFLPNVARMRDRSGFAYVAGQVNVTTGAPSFGNYLTAMRVP